MTRHTNMAFMWEREEMMTEKPFNDGEWTTARMVSFVKSALRRAQWPPKYASLEAACVGRKTNQATGRLAKHYRCAECQGEFPAIETAIDHIKPVVPVEGFDSWDGFIGRLFCEEDGFQILCKGCHLAKSQHESSLRKLNKLKSNQGS